MLEFKWGFGFLLAVTLGKVRNPSPDLASTQWG